MSIVISPSYRSTHGRKPSRPAFCYDFHNDDAGGTAVVDRFGNARDLTLQGTLGASWTGSRGFWRPNGTDQHALVSAGAGEAYAAQNVVADALLTVGNALFVRWRLGWITTKTTTNETVLCIGRGTANSATVLCGVNSAGSIVALVRGSGASNFTSASFGSAVLYTPDKIYDMALHIEATATGLDVSAFLDGVPIGLLQSYAWTNLSGTKPTASQWDSPDGLTIGATRGHTNPATPTFSQLVGGSNGGKSLLANLLAVNLGTANVGTAQDLALELKQYPRATGEILAGL
jgi:hypothetical protein